MKFKRRFFSILVYTALSILLLPVAIFIYKHPAYNFDMLGYMALVVRMDHTSDMSALHDLTYREAKQRLPADEYKRLTEMPAFRKKFAADPAQFAKILPIYSVKPLYVGLCWLFYKMGFSLTRATVMPSIVAFLSIGIFLFSWLRKYLQIMIAFLSTLMIMCSVFIVGIAGQSTPDCVSALFFFAGSYFIIEKRNFLCMNVFFLLSILTRADNVIACFFIISFLAFVPLWGTITRKQYAWMLTGLAIAYICAILPATQFGWNIFYYTQYSRHIDFSRNFDQSIGAGSWLSLMYSKLVTALVSTQFTFFMFLSLLILGTPFPGLKKLTFDQSLLLVLLFIILFRFLLLPDLSDRFYLGFYLVIIILLVRKFSTLTPMHGRENKKAFMV